MIIRGLKPIENRKWVCNHRGPLYIHVGKAFDWEGYVWISGAFPEIDLSPENEFLKGGLIGTVNMTACVTSSPSKWFFGPYGFVFEDVEEIPFVPMKGKLGLFNVTL